jgi:hypothetical protein
MKILLLDSNKKIETEIDEFFNLIKKNELI